MGGSWAWSRLGMRGHRGKQFSAGRFPLLQNPPGSRGRLGSTGLAIQPVMLGGLVTSSCDKTECREHDTLPPGMNADADIRVAVVEDDPVIRDRVALLLQRTPGLACVGALAGAVAAWRELPALAPAVVIMDIRLPDGSGIDCVKALHPRLPATQFVMFTMFEDDDLVFESLAAGAVGYLHKRATPEEIIAAAKDAHTGGSPMSSAIARKVIRVFQKPAPSAAVPETTAGGVGSRLSSRETVLLGHLAQGLTYKEAAAVMGVSLETVRTFVRRIYEKLQVHTRHAAVAWFHEANGRKQSGQ